MTYENSVLRPCNPGRALRQISIRRRTETNRCFQVKTGFCDVVCGVHELSAFLLREALQGCPHFVPINKAKGVADRPM